MDAVAVYAFNPTETDELGFRKGDKLLIVEMEEDPNWYKARKGDREGMVPANYITLYPHNWYVPHCSRREAEARLLERCPDQSLQPDGAFILRQSQNDVGQFSISVKEGPSVLHFRVFSDNDTGQFFVWNNRFNSINELIDYHRHQTIYDTTTLLLRDRLPSKTFGPTGNRSSSNFPRPASTNPTKAGPTNSSPPLALQGGVPPSAKSINFPASLPPASAIEQTPQLPPNITMGILTGRLCVAAFDFSAEYDGELSFVKGDRIRILGEEDANWWYGQLTDRSGPGKCGLIPANYVELLPSSAASSSTN